jgi:hypothetical protein
MATSGSPRVAPSTATVTQMEGNFPSPCRAPPEPWSPPVGESRDAAHRRIGAGDSAPVPGELQGDVWGGGPHRRRWCQSGHRMIHR